MAKKKVGKKKVSTPEIKVQQPIVKTQELPATTRGEESQKPEDAVTLDVDDETASRIKEIAHLTDHKVKEVEGIIEQLRRASGIPYDSILDNLRSLIQGMSIKECFTDKVNEIKDELTYINDQRDQQLEHEARLYWPEGKAMPTHYIKRGPIPCKSCRRVLTDDGGQAVVCHSGGDEIVVMRCKVCEARWQLPVKFK